MLPEKRSTTPQSPYTYREVAIGGCLFLVGTFTILFYPVFCTEYINIRNEIIILGLTIDVFGALILVFPETNGRRWFYQFDKYGKLDCARYNLFVREKSLERGENGFDEILDFLVEKYGKEQDDWSENPGNIYELEYDPARRELELERQGRRPRLEDADVINKRIDDSVSGFFYLLGTSLLVIGFILQIIGRAHIPC